jgi:hypothetical protein
VLANCKPPGKVVTVPTLTVAARLSLFAPAKSTLLSHARNATGDDLLTICRDCTWRRSFLATTWRNSSAWGNAPGSRRPNRFRQP